MGTAREIIATLIVSGAFAHPTKSTCRPEKIAPSTDRRSLRGADDERGADSTLHQSEGICSGRESFSNFSLRIISPTTTVFAAVILATPSRVSKKENPNLAFFGVGAFPGGHRDRV